MKRYGKIFEYAVCMLYGIFFADMIYRAVKFILAYIGAAEEFPKILGVAVAAVGDTYSGYMQASLVISLILAVCGMLCKAFPVHTGVFFGMNVVSGFVFVAILNFINVPWDILLTLAVISFGTYIVSSVLCLVSAAYDIINNILKKHFRENNQ